LEESENTRARALIAIGALLGLGALVAVILVASSGSGSEDEFAPAPESCVNAWNSSQDAVETGRHNSLSHGYYRVQVAYATPDGAEISESPLEGGECVVVFAAGQLDPEIIAAAEIQEGRNWTALSAGGADPARLAELQSQAVGAANATLGPDGLIAPR